MKRTVERELKEKGSRTRAEVALASEDRQPESREPSAQFTTRRMDKMRTTKAFVQKQENGQNEETNSDMCALHFYIISMFAAFSQEIIKHCQYGVL